MTSKYQVTVPKAIADEFKIRPGDEIEWVAAGDVIRVIPPGKGLVPEDQESRLRLFDQATQRLRRRPARPQNKRSRAGAGGERTFILVAALVDTNVLVYRFDGRFPEKQKVATEILRRGIAEDSVRIPHHTVLSAS